MNENQHHPNQQRNQQRNQQQRNLPQNKPKFNFNWIYAIIIAAILGLNIFGNQWEARSFDITWNELQGMLERRDVERVVVVNKELAEVFIKRNRIENDTLNYGRLRTEDLRKPKFFVFRFLTLEQFQNDVRQAQTNADEFEKSRLTPEELENFVPRPKIEPIPETRRGFFEGLGFLWPCLLS